MTAKQVEGLLQEDFKLFELIGEEGKICEVLFFEPGAEDLSDKLYVSLFFNDGASEYYDGINILTVKKVVDKIEELANTHYPKRQITFSDEE